MKYMLLIFNDEARAQARSREDMEKGMAAYMAYAEAMQKAGVLAGADRLRPSGEAATVRVAGDKTTVLDGPYAETKEQLGGYFIVEVPDREAALAWAARCPGASHGVVEVRPLWAM